MPLVGSCQCVCHIQPFISSRGGFDPTPAVAAYGVKLAVDGVKAAIEDEQAQVKLAGSLERVTGATKDQIAAVEEQILKTSLATGVADDELRPALDRLTRSTKNVDQSQKLLNLALDISRGSGKSLESVTNALSKSFEGQNTALGKLGVGISAAQLKTMSFDDITKQLANTFEGAAADAADTFAGKTARLQVAFDEAKESVGAALLPILTRLFDFINEYLVPIFDRFSGDTSALGNNIKNFLTPILNTLQSAYEKISTAVRENADEYRPLINLLKSLAEFVKGTVAPILVDVLGKAFTGNSLSLAFTTALWLTNSDHDRHTTAFFSFCAMSHATMFHAHWRLHSGNTGQRISASVGSAGNTGQRISASVGSAGGPR